MVVKRASHSGQKRRRRMATKSSEGRESFTCVSLCLQNGQRMDVFSFFVIIMFFYKEVCQIFQADDRSYQIQDAVQFYVLGPQVRHHEIQ